MRTNFNLSEHVFMYNLYVHNMLISILLQLTAIFSIIFYVRRFESILLLLLLFIKNELFHQISLFSVIPPCIVSPPNLPFSMFIEIQYESLYYINIHLFILHFDLILFFVNKQKQKYI